MKVNRHLDNIYRSHYEIFHMLWGKEHDSRYINWREVEWEKVIKIDVCIKKYKHTFSLEKMPYSLGFLNYRWGGVHRFYDHRNKKWDKKKIDYWTVGYILPDNKAILTDIDFHLGCILKKDYEKKWTECKEHIHPRLFNRLKQKSLVVT